MREIVEQVIELSEEYHRKTQIHKAEHGIEGGVSLGAEKTEHYLEATQFLANKLKAYLAMLAEKQLRNLEALVYFGRGDEDDILWLHQHLRSVGPTREDVERTIVEKIPALSRYLQNTLSRAEKLGIDIENMPE